jgi:hypothetical protein
MGILFDRFRRADGWRRLGWATEEQYARERVGVSHASLKARLTLARRCDRLPEVAEALDGGRIGFEAASLVARVATPRTASAWIERATERTFKHLREEIEGVEMLARASGDASVLVPPSDEQVAAVADIERWVLTGGVMAGEAVNLASEDAADDSQMSVTPGEAVDLASSAAVNDSQMSVARTPAAGFPANGGEDPSSDSQISGTPMAGDELPRLRRGAGKVTIRLEMSAELAEQWRDLEQRFRRSSLPGSFVAFPCHDDDNLAGLCLWCHLEGIHGGRLRATPPASNIHWTIGRDPMMVVQHRRRMQLSSAEAM